VDIIFPDFARNFNPSSVTLHLGITLFRVIPRVFKLATSLDPESRFGAFIDRCGDDRRIASGERTSRRWRLRRLITARDLTQE
jgi:hypothetical protein